MIDLLIVALAFGLLPLVALILYAMPGAFRRRATAIWGLAAGVVAFLGLAHAGAVLLQGYAFLKFEANPYVAAIVAVVGLLAGIFLGWRLLGHEPEASAAGAHALLGATVVYVALHSLADGLVLGESYAGPAALGIPLDLATVGGTVLHRFAEGSLIAFAALAAGSRPPRALGLLFVGLVAVPAAYVPVVLLAPGSISLTTVTLDQTLSVLAAGLEAGFAILLLTLGILPRLRDAKDPRWALWAGIGFTLLLLVHFLVE